MFWKISNVLQSSRVLCSAAGFLFSSIVVETSNPLNLLNNYFQMLQIGVFCTIHLSQVYHQLEHLVDLGVCKIESDPTLLIGISWVGFF